MAKTKEQADSRPTWTHAYVMATFCLVLGVIIGYLARGTAPPVAEQAQSQPQAQTQAGASSVPTGTFSVPQLLGSSPMTQSGTSAQSKSSLDAAAAPMLQVLKSNPSDFDTLTRLGNLYYDGQAYPEAIRYYESALKIRPDAVEVRTDMGTAYWYSGNADRALAEFDRSLKARPGHPQTLFNTGIVRWQGKNDASGAIAAWEELLQKNPGYPERDKVQQMIAQVKSGRG